MQKKREGEKNKECVPSQGEKEVKVGEIKWDETKKSEMLSSKCTHIKIITESLTIIKYLWPLLNINTILIKDNFGILIIFDLLGGAGWNIPNLINDLHFHNLLDLILNHFVK